MGRILGFLLELMGFSRTWGAGERTGDPTPVRVKPGRGCSGERGEKTPEASEDPRPGEPSAYPARKPGRWGPILSVHTPRPRSWLQPRSGHSLASALDHLLLGGWAGSRPQRREPDWDTAGQSAASCSLWGWAVQKKGVVSSTPGEGPQVQSQR